MLITIITYSWLQPVNISPSDTLSTQVAYVLYPWI